jgi:hypothetical protein
VPPPSPEEHNLWLPPRHLRRYQRAKLLGGTLVVAIFAGWLYLQWSNLAMRLVAIALILATAWVVLSSMLADANRARGRQIAVEGDKLRVTRPEGETLVTLADAASAEWRDEPIGRAGLWLLDARGQSLAHLDAALLADQAEARVFLGWLRDRTGITLPTRWPATL